MPGTDEASFAKKLSGYSRFIGYSPMADEPDYGDFLKKFAIGVPQEIIPADPSLDPFDVAKKMSSAYTEVRVAVFVPGQRFDSFGTRHGRGHGWYDRFLSGIPREWFRVGVLNADQFSNALLERKSWDEPMDALLISENSAWRIVLPESGL